MAKRKYVLPNTDGRPIARPIELQRSYFTNMARILRDPSYVLQQDRTMQRQMRNDPDVMGPLMHLQASVAQLEWEVVPDNADDDVQQRLADAASKALAAAPRWPDMLRHLLEAVWYGPSMVNLIWEMPHGAPRITDWIPIHPDTLIATMDGDIGLKVGAKYYSGPDPGHSMSDTVPGFDSRVRLLDERERAACVIHVFNRGGPDFDSPYETAQSVLGRGMRDVCYPYWMLKQVGLQSYAAFIERYAQGIRIGYYPTGNDSAREQMENILRNLVGDVSVALPRSSPDAKDFEIEIKDPNSARGQLFIDLVRFCEGNIKEVILGQSATSEATAGGMNSGVANEHANTFSRQMTFVADGLASSISSDILTPLVDFLGGPGDAPYPRFRFSAGKPNAKQYLDAVRVFVNELGGVVSEREVRKTLGLSEPRPEEPILTGKSRDLLPTFDEATQEDDAVDAFAKARFGTQPKKHPKDCGTGSGGFGNHNTCASGDHDYPDNRKHPGQPVSRARTDVERHRGITAYVNPKNRRKKHKPNKGPA